MPARVDDMARVIDLKGYFKSPWHNAQCASQCRHESCTELLEALKSTDPDNPYAVRIGAAIDELTAILAKAAEDAGAWPQRLIVKKPADEVEALALDLFAQHLAEAGISIQIKRDEP